MFSFRATESAVTVTQTQDSFSGLWSVFMQSSCSRPRPVFKPRLGHHVSGLRTGRFGFEFGSGQRKMALIMAFDHAMLHMKFITFFFNWDISGNFSDFLYQIRFCFVLRAGILSPTSRLLHCWTCSLEREFRKEESYTGHFHGPLRTSGLGTWGKHGKNHQLITTKTNIRFGVT
jgi:hypothetical protein